MTKLLDRATREIIHPQSPLAFSTTGGGAWGAWDRYLTLNGKQAYHLGNICGTCAFFFERMEGANAGIDVGDLTTLLSKGLSNLSPEVVNTLAQLLPPSEYVIALIRLKPELVQLSGQNDYFAVEQMENEEGEDPFWELPHNPKVPYYRVEGRSGLKIPGNGSSGAAFDFLIPIFPETSLQSEKIAHYENMLQDGMFPTAVALSILDVKRPACFGTDHWCLAHYVLDGHHKIAAAARTQRELTLISFIAVDHGISSKEQIEMTLKSYNS
jgi:hypothetical protein